MRLFGIHSEPTVPIKKIIKVQVLDIKHETLWLVVSFWPLGQWDDYANSVHEVLAKYDWKFNKPPCNINSFQIKNKIIMGYLPITNFNNAVKNQERYFQVESWSLLPKVILLQCFSGNTGLSWTDTNSVHHYVAEFSYKEWTKSIFTFESVAALSSSIKVGGGYKMQEWPMGI